MVDMTQPITNMTYADLERFIQKILDERLRGFAPYELASEDHWQLLVDNIKNQQLKQPSPTQMLQEERDHWYKNS